MTDTTPIQIKTAVIDDLTWLIQFDHHISDNVLRTKVSAGEMLLASLDAQPVGWLRWGYFWDSIPFMNHLFVLEPQRGKGIGRKLVTAWEEQMRNAGFSHTMASTLSNESAQHLYRKWGYTDRGALLLANEPLEIIFVKAL